MLLALIGLASAAPPAMLTTTQGPVSLDGAPVQAPFVLAEGQALELGQGALVVLLYQGAATQVQGPTSLSLSNLEAASASSGEGEVALLEGLMARDTTTARTGATRAGGVVLQRPVAGDTVMALQTLSWACEQACPQAELQVYSFRQDAVVWTGTGQGGADYSGPALAPGAYTLSVSGQEFGFKVASAQEQETLGEMLTASQAIVAASEHLSPSAKAGIPASLFVQAGYISEALWIMDRHVATTPDPLTQARLEELERRAGLR